MKTKKKIMKILTVITAFVLLISMITKVDATSYKISNEYKKINDLNSFEDVNTNITDVDSDTSGAASKINIFVGMMIPIVMNIMCLIGILLLIRGIVFIIKKEIKKGVISIVISIMAFLVGVLTSFVYHPSHNIMS